MHNLKEVNEPSNMINIKTIINLLRMYDNEELSYIDRIELICLFKEWFIEIVNVKKCFSLYDYGYGGYTFTSLLEKAIDAKTKHQPYASYIDEIINVIAMNGGNRAMGGQLITYTPVHVSQQQIPHMLEFILDELFQACDMKTYIKIIDGLVRENR